MDPPKPHNTTRDKMQRVYTRFIFSTSHRFDILHKFSQIYLYSTSSSSSTNDFTDYLMNSLGFSHQKAIITSNKLVAFPNVSYSNLSTNAVSVVNLFKDYAFDDAHIQKVVSLFPTLLTYSVDNTIKPKLGFLINQGFSGINLISIVTRRPWILSRKFGSSISTTIQFLREFLVCDSHVTTAFENLYFRNKYLATNYLSSNVAFLTSYGVPVELIRKHLVKNPVSFVRDPESLKDIVIRVEKKLGISPCSTMFLYGVHLLSKIPEESIESKCRLFKSFGWTQGDVEMLMMKNPTCFLLADDNLKRKLSFLMNELKLEPSYLITRLMLFTSSLETRLVPRHDVFQIVTTKGLLEKNFCFYTVVRLPESRFLKLFVLPFEEVHQVYANHFGCTSLETLIQEQTSTQPSTK